MELTFLGAAETVTGSRFLIDANQKRLLVDCGLFQGLKKLRERNWAPFPVKPESLDAVILTHAHIDHSGYIPRLCKNGFQGNIYCTEATLDLCKILLPDAGYLQEKEAERANRYGYSRHKPALPLYTEEDALRSLKKKFFTQPYNSFFCPAGGLNARFRTAGNIRGAASLKITEGRKRLTFTGDVGRMDDPVMRPPDLLEDTDYLVIESTYGDRRHSPVDPLDTLEATIQSTFKKGGNVLIPSFAVGRAQYILYLLDKLISENRIPAMPIYLDSPMAIDATELFYHHQALHKLTKENCKSMCSRAIYTPTVEESKAIASQPMPKIIISASGMLTGGRILHHLKTYVGNKNNTVVFPGYQAAGTRGATMLSGEETVKIHGEYFPVRAKLVQVEGLSAHADHHEMIQWLTQSAINPKKTFIVHGEPQSQDAFRRHLKDRLGWAAIIPGQGDSEILT
jgi:metallo-beta-lactamase family protein